MLSWTEQKVKRASVASGGSTIADAFGAAFPVPLGRVDADAADEAVKIPTQSASPTEVKVRGKRAKGHVYTCTHAQHGTHAVPVLASFVACTVLCCHCQ